MITVLLLLDILLLLYLVSFPDVVLNRALPVLLLSVLFLSLLFLLIRGEQTSLHFVSVINRYSPQMLLAAISIYLVILFVAPQSWHACGWLIIGGLNQIMLAIVVGLNRVKWAVSGKRFLYLFVMHWLSTCGFIISICLWLTIEPTMSSTMVPITPWLIITMVLSLALAMLYISLTLIDLAGRAHEKNNQGTQLSREELFSYTHDPATNLPSYQQALKQLEQALKQGKNQRFAAIVFKPVNFQQVNSVLGHHNSDLLLLQLAYCIQQKVQENKCLINFDAAHQPIRLARLQGLNFLVVAELAHTSHPEKIVINDLCQQLADAVPDAMSFKSFSLNFELAFGIAFARDYEINAAELIAFAGDALLDAEQHQQMLCYFDNSTTLYTEQQLLKMERLKQDLKEENLRWYLQPQIALDNKSIRGFELMVHWYCEEDVAQELHEFINIAEQSGEIHLLMKNMIVQAFRILAQLQQLEIYQPLSINIPSKDLLESELIDFIELQSEIFVIDCKYLVIELTEEVMSSATTRTKSIIDQLKVLNIAIAIDQFSGSYESLRYLRKMAINQVKINCYRLNGQVENRADKAIINSLINLTRTMGLPMIGICIDSSEVEQMFTAMGGEVAQGKIINRGVVPAELEIWLKRWKEQYPEEKSS